MTIFNLGTIIGLSLIIVSYSVEFNDDKLFKKINQDKLHLFCKILLWTGFYVWGVSYIIYVIRDSSINITSILLMLWVIAYILYNVFIPAFKELKKYLSPKKKYIESVRLKYYPNHYDGGIYFAVRIMRTNSWNIYNDVTETSFIRLINKLEKIYLNKLFTKRVQFYGYSNCIELSYIFKEN